MSPKSIAALRDFSAACRHSPEPARSVADLAQLLAALAEADGQPMPVVGLLSEFATFARQSPEPARSVADLAKLLADHADANSVATTAEPAGTAAPAVSALVPEEPPFPPVVAAGTEPAAEEQPAAAAA